MPAWILTAHATKPALRRRAANLAGGLFTSYRSESLRSCLPAAHTVQSASVAGWLEKLNVCGGQAVRQGSAHLAADDSATFKDRENELKARCAKAEAE